MYPLDCKVDVDGQPFRNTSCPLPKLGQIVAKRTSPSADVGRNLPRLRTVGSSFESPVLNF